MSGYPDDVASDPTVIDGRRARRQRGRHAVVDAMIAMIEEGQAPSSADDVAERAGVSVATLFRNFGGLDDLRSETIARFIDRHRDLYEIPGSGGGDRGDRIDDLVKARLQLYSTIAPVARFVRSRAGELPTLARSLRERRRYLADQIDRHFEAELASLTPARRAEVVGTISTLTSFESWDMLISDLGLSTRRIRHAWASGLEATLAGLASGS